MRNFAMSLVVILLLASCSKGSYIALKDAERGMFLDRASKTSVKIFFERRMESELENNLNKDWYIVNEDLDYIYFGQLKKKNEFTMINPFYKVNREKLTSKFPGFRAIEGKHIKAKVFQTFVKPLIEENLIPKCPQSYNVQYGKRKYKLTDEGIESDVQFVGSCYEDKMFKANLHVLLDSENLEVLEVETNLR